MGHCNFICGIATISLLIVISYSSKLQDPDQDIDHPLRNNVFELTAKVLGKRQAKIKLYFLNNGMVLCPSTKELGNWELDPGGGRVSWYLNKLNSDLKPQSYSAEWHLNHFGKSSRMIKGIILQDRKSLNIFRRVLASFEAVGVETDEDFYKFKTKVTKIRRK